MCVAEGYMDVTRIFCQDCVGPALKNSKLLVSAVYHKPRGALKILKAPKPITTLPCLALVWGAGVHLTLCRQGLPPRRD